MAKMIASYQTNQRNPMLAEGVKKGKQKFQSEFQKRQAQISMMTIIILKLPILNAKGQKTWIC